MRRAPRSAKAAQKAAPEARKKARSADVQKSLYSMGMARVAIAAPATIPADPLANAEQVVTLAREADKARAALCLFPELCLSAYAIDDLLLQDALLDAVKAAIARVALASRDLLPVLIVGAPLAVGPALYNCAVVLHRGRVLGVVPKTYLPNYREYYEKRHFASGDEATERLIEIAGEIVPFGVDLLFSAQDLADFVFHVEICEDMWAPVPPSTFGALAGATILCNLSASNALIGKAEERNLLCDAQSRRCAAAYLYSGAGAGESTTDLAWDGHLVCFELGEKLVESARYERASRLVTADVDLERLRLERLRTPTFRDAAARHRDRTENFRRAEFDLDPPTKDHAPLRRKIARFPFVPSDPAHLDRDCREAYEIQVHGLVSRLQATGIRRVVVGVSGGLDSTQALIVATRALDSLGLKRSAVIGVTMPGFATSRATKSNARALMAALGVEAREIDIRPAARRMLEDIGHPYAEGKPVYDTTFENVQAGLRTDYLFRIANKEGGLVVGTGDLSELALGWCTYGVGDQMAHYNVNGSVAKTLIQHLIGWCAASGAYDAATAKILRAILAGEITPELTPPDADGAIQRTEDIVGPYALADFALYYLTRYGLRPSKIAYLAEAAWSDAARGAWPPNLPESAKVAYSRAEIRRWLRVFLARFFQNQFKRSAMPNGPKISSGGALSPRGDWRMPSDASAAAWLADLDD